MVLFGMATDLTSATFGKWILVQGEALSLELRDIGS